jgi:hypothetical protein
MEGRYEMQEETTLAARLNELAPKRLQEELDEPSSWATCSPGQGAS